MSLRENLNPRFMPDGSHTHFALKVFAALIAKRRPETCETLIPCGFWVMQKMSHDSGLKPPQSLVVPCLESEALDKMFFFVSMKIDQNGFLTQ